MKKKLLTGILLTGCLSGIGYSAEAQLAERIKQTVKNKVEERVERKVGETVDKGADELEESVNKQISEGSRKKEPKKTQPVSSKNTQSVRSEFVPGEQVIYQEDFSQDELGEFPLKWFTNNKGVIVTRQGVDGQWLKMTHSSLFLSPLLSNNLPDNFTIEFDLILDLKYDGYVFPLFRFGFFENIHDDANGRKYLHEDRNKASLSAVDIVLAPGTEDNSEIALQSSQKGLVYFDHDGNRLPDLAGKYGKPVRVSIWVQKRRMRLWLDGTKVYDVPQSVPEGIQVNRLVLQIGPSIQPDEEIGIYTSNIRVAAAGADARTKLIKEGRFSTNGILFETNSDKILPASAPVLKEIAAVLKENPAVRVRIIGHTDSDGSEADNLDLSKRRAASVAKALSGEYGIDATRLIADGRGETDPVADNKTEAGKAKNRRVEFVNVR